MDRDVGFCMDAVGKKGSLAYSYPVDLLVFGHQYQYNMLSIGTERMDTCIQVALALGDTAICRGGAIPLLQNT